MSVTGIITGAKAGSTAIMLAKQAKELGLLDKLINVFKKKHKILVLGATGVGKTLFIKSITEELPKAIGNLNRTNSIVESALKISENIFVFVDTPGQEGHEAIRKKEIKNALKNNIAGIINITAFGYHEARADEKIVFDKNGKVKSTFLMERRKREIDLLKEWVDLIGNKDTANWLITLVNKADLWWDKKDKVFEHYEKGDYCKALDSAKSLSPSVLHYSAVFHKFYGKSPICGTFDDNDRIESKEILLTNLISAIGKGGLKL